MVDIPLAYEASRRTGFPEAALLNCIVEKGETQIRTELALLARPGLQTLLASLGVGPIRGAFQRDGVFDGDALFLSGTTLYRVKSSGATSSFTGTVPGDGYVTIDAGQNADLEDIARIATGSALYLATAATMTVAAEDFPAVNGAGASSVCFNLMYFLATEAGTDKVYFRDAADTAWVALQFASAEYRPDPIQAVRALSDLFALLGRSSLEFWQLTGQADPAIAPVPGLRFNYGCRSGLSAVVTGASLIWVDDTNSVRRSEGGEGRVVSPISLIAEISAVSAMDIRASGFVLQGHYYYVLRLAGVASWVYDLSSETWSRFSSKGYEYWRPHLFCSVGDRVLAADSVSTAVYLVDPDTMTDVGEVFTMEFTAFDEVETNTPVYNLALDCETGKSPRTGQGSAPLIRMRFKDTDQRGWSSWSDLSLGAAGESPRVRWRRLGTIRGPGRRIYGFQVSDPVVRRITSLKRNVS